jgi:hypothetical protein
MSFKVGDRVYVMNYRDYPSVCEKPCTITEIGPLGPMQYFVRFDDPRLGTGSFVEGDLRLEQ